MMMVYFYLNGGKITVPDGFVINYNKQSNHPDIIDSWTFALPCLGKVEDNPSKNNFF